MLDFFKFPVLGFYEKETVFPVWTYVSQYGRHVGLIFLSDDSGDGEEEKLSAKYFHFHKEVECREINPSISTKKFIAAKVGFEKPVAIEFAAYLEVVSKKKMHLKYGLNMTASFGTFDFDGNVAVHAEHTCATFVAALFKGRGFPLFDFETWPKNSKEDKDWRDQQVAYYEKSLANQGADAPIQQDGIDLMKKLDPVMRLRPCHVAGVLADQFDKKTRKNHEIAQELAVQVISAFTSVFGADPNQHGVDA